MLSNKWWWHRQFSSEPPNSLVLWVICGSFSTTFSTVTQNLGCGSTVVVALLFHVSVLLMQYPFSFQLSVVIFIWLYLDSQCFWPFTHRVLGVMGSYFQYTDISWYNEILSTADKCYFHISSNKKIKKLIMVKIKQPRLSQMKRQ